MIQINEIAYFGDIRDLQNPVEITNGIYEFKLPLFEGRPPTLVPITLSPLPLVIYDAKRYQNYLEEIKTVSDMNRQLEKSTGIALLGKPGSGKSMLLNMALFELAKDNIVIFFKESSESFEYFDRYILDEEKVSKNLVIIIEEVDKKFVGSESNLLLESLQRPSKSSAIWFLTSNEDHLPRYINNRPSRVCLKILFDNIKYENLKQELITQLATTFEDNLIKYFIEKFFARYQGRKIEMSPDSLNFLIRRLKQFSPEDLFTEISEDFPKINLLNILMESYVDYKRVNIYNMEDQLILVGSFDTNIGPGITEDYMRVLEFLAPEFEEFLGSLIKISNIKKIEDSFEGVIYFNKNLIKIKIIDENNENSQGF